MIQQALHEGYESGNTGAASRERMAVLQDCFVRIALMQKWERLNEYQPTASVTAITQEMRREIEALLDSVDALASQPKAAE